MLFLEYQGVCKAVFRILTVKPASLLVMWESIAFSGVAGGDFYVLAGFDVADLDPAIGPFVGTQISLSFGILNQDCRLRLCS
jgi:hypothetical protein